MKKLILSAFLLTALLGNISISAQDKIGLQKYDYVTNGDANVFQGIPNIGLPLLGLEIPTAGVGINLSINYTTESLARYSLISDVGQGWNLSSVGSIVRDKTRRAEDYKKESNGKVDSDVFNYNYPGGSGKFFITNNSSTQELEAVHTSPSNDKIAITKDTKEGKIKSFTITDTKGNSYLFDKLNINTINISDITTITRMVNSGFFLSKIFNIKNEEAAVIEYETTTELYNQFLGSLQQQKIKKITVHGIGSIEYLYRHIGPAPLLSVEKNADWYILDKLVLKDTRNTVINQYAFERSGDHLIGLINLDKNSNQIQKFSFEYNPVPSGSGSGSDSFGYPNAFNCGFDGGILHSPEGRNQEACTYGALKSITLPSGGKTEYEFESQALPHNNNSASNGYYDHYPFEKIKTITYRTEPGQYPPPYTVPANYKVAMVKFDALYYGPPVRPGTPEYSIYINGVEPQLYTYGVNNNQVCQNGLLAFESEGTLNFTFQGKSEGTIELYAFKKTRIDENDYGHGLRIKSIKNFNSGASSPLSYTKYEYSLFDNPLRSSGAILDQSVELSFIDGSREGIKPIGYTNIKVTDMINGSYSKYYFRNPDDITPGITPSFGFSDKDMGTYIRSMGLLEKKETYSEGQLLQKNEMSYELKQVPLSNIVEGTTAAVKKIIISKQSSITENYISGTAEKLVSSSENSFEDTYSNLTSSKETLFDGTVVEKALFYPADKGVQKLISANMVDIPLETSTKRNGKLVGKAETKFDDGSNVYPTSVIDYNMQTQTPFTESKLDVYDSKGNVVQVTGKNGIPTTTIWGYYQTKPIAVITGVAYSQVVSLATVIAAIDASNADRDNPANEPALLQALEALRKDLALKDYSITASTYDPMIGVTNSISSNGIRTVNIYDNANRLLKVTDAEGKTLQENQYNYKH